MTNIDIIINEEKHHVYSSNYSQETVLVVLETLKRAYDNMVCGCSYRCVEDFIYDNLPHGINIKNSEENVLFRFED